MPPMPSSIADATFVDSLPFHWNEKLSDINHENDNLLLVTYNLYIY